MKGFFVFLWGALIALGAGWAGFPRLLYKTTPQSLDFNHQVHGDKAGMKCEDCHAFRADGTFAGIPRLEQCAGCHAAPMGSAAAEKNFIDAYVTPQREPVWHSYSRQPENVYFSHIRHVKLGSLSCEQCHPGHGASRTLKPHQEDRISGYSRDVWDRMLMDDCIDCHRERKLEPSCMDCHK
jgi:menaquinone reductase, multiheme cytochrome c subunit